MRVDVAIDARRTRQMSTGTRAYLDALLDGLPRVAPDLAIARIGRGEHFGVDEHLRLPVEVLSQRPRLVHFITPVAPLVRPAPYVVTVHDLIHLRFPELHARQAQLYYAILGRRLIRGARRILVGDERTVEDCVRLVGVPPERCRVVPLGFDPVLLTDDAIEQRPHPYVFYAGNHRAHKNLATLFAAWHALPPSVELDCVVTGPNDLPAALPRTRPGGAIVTLGQVDRARLSRLYRGALAYVHPALVEGFGIPMLEAAAVGTPVIAAAECVPTVVRGIAQTFAARDVVALRDLLAAVAAAPEAARRRAREVAPTLGAYTWDRFASAVAAVYRELLSEITPI